MSEPEQDGMVNMTIPVDVSIDAVTVALVHGGNSSEKLVAIVKGIDEESQDWDFTLELAEWLLGTLVEYADEVDSEQLADALNAVRDLLDKIKAV